MKKRILFFLVFIIPLIAFLLISRGYIGSLIHPLPFEGPYNGAVIDADNGNPIPGAKVEAVWWCYDSPDPHFGNYWVSASVDTDEKGRYSIRKPKRRDGWFGSSFTFRVNAKGYIPAIFAVEPSGISLPKSTEEYPFIDTTINTSLPAVLDILLKPCKPVLLKALNSDNAQYRWVAAQELGRIGKDARYAVGPLIFALKDHDPGVRKYATEALGKIGPDAKDAVPALIATLGDKDIWVRLMAIDALGAIDYATYGSVGALTKLLNDKDSSIRTHAVRSLSKFGPRAKDAAPALRQILRQRWITKYFRNEVEYALEKIDPAENAGLET